MKNKIALLGIICLLVSANLFAQRPPLKQSEASKQRSKDRAEYGTFRHQILALKEFSDEKRKIPRLQKENKGIVTIVANIDSVDNDEVKTLTGYITEVVGDNSTNVYEITFDRAERKITSVKKTGEGEDPEAKEAGEKTTTQKAPAGEVKKPAHKKKGEDEDDDDEDEKTAPSKDKDGE